MPPRAVVGVGSSGLAGHVAAASGEQTGVDERRTAGPAAVSTLWLSDSASPLLDTNNFILVVFN